PESEDVTPALDLVEEELKKGTYFSPWLLVRLAELATQAGLAERVTNLAGSEWIKDPALRGRMQLPVLLERLKGAGDKVDDALFNAVTAESIASAQARLAIVRHAAQQGNNLAREGDSWDETLRPFGYAGIALGQQDPRR